MAESEAGFVLNWILGFKVYALSLNCMPPHLLHAAGLGGGLCDVCEAAAEAEAAQLDAPVLIQQHVGRLQVAVDDAFRVQVLRRPGGQPLVRVYEALGARAQ